MHVRIWSVAWCFLAYFVNVYGITNNNGSYEDINVIIQDSVPEDDVLISKIQEAFTNASQLLFRATKQHVYFGKVNIILPKTWTPKSEYTSMPARSELDTYITVEDGRIKRPHTKPKRGKCGLEMRYIYLPTGFLLTEGKTKWGYHDTVLVHEWGHYRWGLYDEYSTNGTGRFYMKDGAWKPSRCSESINGEVGMGSKCKRQEQCDLSNTEQTLSWRCQFCPDENQDENSGSVMAYNWIDAVSMFCDNPDDPSVPAHQRHNRDATNKHNKKCNHRSAWEVMRDHTDFLNAPLPVTTDTSPTFDIIQESECYRVFVLDKSGSMRGSLIANLHAGSKLLIETMIEDGSWLGIVWFDLSPDARKNLTKVNSTSVRNDLINALPTYAGGGTCIGCGIESALTMLTNALGDPAGASIIVVSDGQDGTGNLDAAIQDAIDAKVTIHTLSVTQAADLRMQYMATATGGSYKVYFESKSSIAAPLFDILDCGVTSYSSGSTTLLSETLNTTASTESNFTFNIDDSIGANTTISLLLDIITDVELEIIYPNGSRHTENKNGNSITVVLPGTSMAGQYVANVRTAQPSTFEYYVTSSPSDTEVIRVTTLIEPATLDFQSTGQLPVIYADVMKGRAPILKADVTAIVDTVSTSCSVILLDNGADPDDFLDDGTYTGVIPSICLSNGRLAIKIYVHGESGKSLILNDFGGAGSPDTDDDANNTETLTTSFQRVTVADEIQVTGVVTQDIVAPGQISDVNIVGIVTEQTPFGESRNFTITWTATGDDVNIGQAVEYEMRISSNQSVLLNNFSSADLLEFGNSSFTPSAAGVTEAIKIVVDAEESFVSTVYFALRAKDDAGNVGTVSNIVSIVVANGFRIKVEGGVDVVYSLTDNSVDESPFNVQEKENLIGLAVGLSGAVAFIVIAIIVVTCCAKKLKAKEVVEDRNFNSRTSITTVTTIDKPLKDFLKSPSRQTAAKSTFEPSRLPTIQEREQVWKSHFSSRPMSAASVISRGSRKSFDIVSQGGCSIEILMENGSMAEQMEEYLSEPFSLNSGHNTGLSIGSSLSLNTPENPPIYPIDEKTQNDSSIKHVSECSNNMKNGEGEKNKNEKVARKGAHTFDDFEVGPETTLTLNTMDNEAISEELRKCYAELY